MEKKKKKNRAKNRLNEKMEQCAQLITGEKLSMDSLFKQKGNFCANYRKCERFIHLAGQ